MFMTTPDFEQWVPSALAPEGGAFWRAMTLVNQTPWYLVTYKHHEDDSVFVQTTLVAWESTLIEMVEALGAASVLSVHCVAPCHEGVREWAMRLISELWLPTDEEARNTGPLLFALDGEEGLYDSFHSKVLSREHRRKLLLRVGS